MIRMSINSNVIPPIKYCVRCDSVFYSAGSKCKRCYGICLQEKSDKILCACNCGTWIYSKTTQGYEKKYVQNHHKRGKKLSLEMRAKFRLARRTFPINNYSSIQRTVDEELTKRNIFFVSNYITRIRGFIHPVDIFIPPNVCIEIDGEHFHTNLIHSRYGYARLGNLSRDYIIDFELEKSGYRVYRYWGYDVIHNLPWVMNQISKIIGNSPISFDDRIYCKCGCGEQRKPYDSKGRRRVYIHGHKNKRKDKGKRTCIDCNTSKVGISYNKYGDPFEQWHKLEDKFLCQRCYDQRRYYRNDILV